MPWPWVLRPILIWKLAFHDLRELKVDVAYPFLLELYHDYANDVLSKADFADVIRLIEAYVFRRAICAIPTNSLNQDYCHLHQLSIYHPKASRNS